MKNFTSPAFYETLKTSRKNILGIMNKYSEEQLRIIPTGFGNNILWNAGHMVTSLQLLCYATSELPLHVPDHFLPLFRKGTSPTNWTEKVDIAEVKSLLVTTIDDLENDYLKGLFKIFNPYVTSFGVTLNSIEEAIIFNHIHEGLHFAAVKALMKAV
jgi:DinB superfamily